MIVNDFYETLSLDVANGIATVTLKRPDAMNAISMGMFADISAVFSRIEDDASIRVVILTGHGRAFSTGADLKERQTMTPSDVRRRRRLAPRVFGAVANCRKPVIAAINGLALGGGFELALACDLLIATESAQMAMPETSLGVIPGGGATQRLPRMIAPHKAKELIFTGRRFGAREAFDLGILNRVVADESLMAEVLALAGQMLNIAPIALGQAKRAINAASNMGIEAGLEFEAEAYQACISSSDRLEALAAFREKRSPHFTGE